MHALRALARFNRHVTNPIQRRWAGVLPFYGIVEHTGRKSGRTYRTPLLMFRTGDRATFIVGYGLASDWTRNLQAAGGGGLQHRRRHYRLTEVALVPAPDGLQHLPGPLRTIARVVGIEAVLTATMTPA